MDVPKDVIKYELIHGSNNILSKYKEKYIVDDVAIMNSSKDVKFLGNLRVQNEDSVKKIEKDLKFEFEDYGNIKIRNRKVVPCCSLPYVHISFQITIPK